MASSTLMPVRSRPRPRARASQGGITTRGVRSRSAGGTLRSVFIGLLVLVGSTPLPQVRAESAPPLSDGIAMCSEGPCPAYPLLEPDGRWAGRMTGEVAQPQGSAFICTRCLAPGLEPIPQTIASLVVDAPNRPHAIYLGTADGEVIQLSTSTSGTDAVRTRRIALETGYGERPLVRALLPFGEDTLLVAGDDYLWIVPLDLTAARIQRMHIDGLGASITSMASLSSKGPIVVGTPRGAFCVDPAAEWKARPLVGSPPRVRNLLVADHRLVIGARGDGLAWATWSEPVCSSISSLKPLGGPQAGAPDVAGLARDGDRLVVGSADGRVSMRSLELEQARPWTTLLDRPIEAGRQLVSIVNDSTPGRFWIGFNDLLVLIDGGGDTIARLGEADGVDLSSVSSLAVDPVTGILWVGRTVAPLEPLRTAPVPWRRLALGLLVAICIFLGVTSWRRRRGAAAGTGSRSAHLTGEDGGNAPLPAD